MLSGRSHRCHLAQYVKDTPLRELCKNPHATLAMVQIVCTLAREAASPHRTQIQSLKSDIARIDDELNEPENKQVMEQIHDLRLRRWGPEP